MMKKHINIFVADSAGNITIFVTDKFSRPDYPQVASQLLEMKEPDGEQVAFVTGENSMDMCGLEFCGNASRAFALFTAKKQGIKGDTIINVAVSGCDEVLPVHVNTDTGYTKIKNAPAPVCKTYNTGYFAPCSASRRKQDCRPGRNHARCGTRFANRFRNFRIHQRGRQCEI